MNARVLSVQVGRAQTFEAPYVRIFSPEFSQPPRSQPRPGLEEHLPEIVDVLRPWAEEAAAANARSRKAQVV